jgi:hypothetical protein
MFKITACACVKLWVLQGGKWFGEDGQLIVFPDPLRPTPSRPPMPEEVEPYLETVFRKVLYGHCLCILWSLRHHCFYFCSMISFLKKGSLLENPFSCVFFFLSVSQCFWSFWVFVCFLFLILHSCISRVESRGLHGKGGNQMFMFWLDVSDFSLVPGTCSCEKICVHLITCPQLQTKVA